jgi:hypothetical protein
MSGEPTPEGDAQAVVKEIRIAGQKLDPSKKYRMAAGGGVIETIRFINSVIPGTVPMGSLQDTGIEDWKVMENYLASMGELTLDRIPHGNRVKTLQADLGILRDQISWTALGKNSRGHLRARIRAIVSNNGGTASSSGTDILITGHGNGIDESVERRSIPLAQKRQVPGLAPGEKTAIEWEVEVPGERDIYPVTIQIEKGRSEVNLSNNSATYYWVN